MLPELREWEEEAQFSQTNLLIVTSGTVDKNRALGRHSRVVLDNAFTIGQDHRVTGTSSAILLDAEGRVASPLVAGADAVLDLLYEQIEDDAEPRTGSNS